MNRKNVSRVLAALLAMLMVLSFCPVSVFAEGETADVTVTVVSAADSSPIAGASVSVPEGTPVLTGADGTAVLAGLTVGQEYQVSVTADGYKNGSQTFTCAVDTPVTVKLSLAAADVNVTVTDQEGSPLSGVSLTLEGVEGSVTTDAAGSAVLKSLTMGESYKLTAALAYYNSGSLTFTCDEKTVAEGLTVKLTPYTKTSVKGAVYCDEVPVSGVTVKLVMAEGETAKTATTGSNGTFSFTDVYQELVESLTVEDSDPYGSFEALLKEGILFGEDSSNTLELKKKVFTITTIVAGGEDSGKVTAEPGEVTYGENAVITVTAGEKFSIYYLDLNESGVESDAYGTNYYTFTLENITANQKLTAFFNEDVEIVSFLVDGEGRVYVEDEDGKPVEVEAKKVPGLDVTVQKAEDDTKEVTVKYTPATNYRVSQATVDAEDPVVFTDNNQSYSHGPFTLTEGSMRKFTLEIRLNLFKVTLPDTIRGQTEVSYGRSTVLKIEPPEGKYLSKLTVNGTDVTSAVSYNGEITYQIEQVQADQTVEAEYADITEAPDNSVTLETSGKIYNPDGTSTYYLGAAGKVTLAPATSGVSVSASPNGPFSPILELTADETVEALYLLEGTTITKVTYRESIKTIVDLESPKVTNTKSEDIYGGFWNLQVIAVKFTVKAKDNENGCGISRVVYSTSKKELSYKDVLALETTVPEDSTTPGTYVIEFNNVKGKYRFWAIDHLDNVYKFDTELEVDCEVDPPTLNNFQVLDGYVTFSGVNYPTKDGVTFSVSVTDAQSGIQSVTLEIGNSTIDMVHDTGSVYKATVRPEDIQDIGDLSIGVWARDDSVNTNKSSTEMLKVPDSEENFLLTFEKDPPKADVGDFTAQQWYIHKASDDDDVAFTVTLTDDGSGINPDSIKVTNEAEGHAPFSKTITYFAEGAAEDAAGSVKPPEGEKVVKAVISFAVNGEAGKTTEYSFQIYAEDNEGNSLTFTGEEDAPLAFSIDGTAPVIEKFDIVEADKDPEEMPLGDNEALAYGYYFPGDTTIRVYTSDTGSDVGSISFYKMRCDVENPEAESVEPNKTELIKDGDRWYAEFTVEAGFKGQIYAYAVDKVGNSNQADPGADAHPENLTTAETQEQHNKLTHVTVELPKTENYDEKGYPLFAGVVYEYDESGNLVLGEDGNPTPAEDQPFQDGIPVTVTVSDTFNGIQSVTYTVKLPKSAEKTPDSTDGAQENLTILTHTLLYAKPDGDASEGETVIPNTVEEFTDGNGIVWTVGREKNLVTTLSAIIPITEESNDISVVVTMKDMANNATAGMEDNPVKLSIDNTPPKIEISHLLVDKNASKEVPSEGTALSTEKEAPNFVGFNTEKYGKTGPYNLYSVPPQDKNDPQKTTTLRIKVTERNLGKLGTEEDKKAFLKNLAENAANVFQQLLPTSDIKEVTTDNLAKNLLVFGPYVDVEGERKDAQYPYTADTYYLIELRDCGETAEEGGTYQTAFTLTDLAGYQAKDGENFVIDSISPIITITFDNNDVRNGKYYNADRIATITVVERNFNNESGDVDGEASLDGRGMDFPGISGWTDSGDFLTHTATVSFTTDGRYRNFTATYTDLAGHTASFQADEFHVDKTMPEIIIADIQDKSANNGIVAPSITYTDINLDLEEVEIALTGVNNGPVDYPTLKETIHNGEEVVYLDFEYVKSVDDVYTLFVKAEDLAGNTTTETIRFSCNRFGSVFDLSQIRDMLGKYNRQGRTLVITETNVDSIDFLRLRVTLTKNGVPVDLVLGKDFFIESLGSEGTWHQYVYRFLENLFDDDGTYSIYIYTVDAAGNISENIDDLRDAQISFGIDKTKPIVTPIDFESGKQYAMESKTVTVEVKDNLLLDGVKIYLNGEEIPFQNDGDSYTFQIPMRNSKQNVRIVAVDSAGNEEELFVSEFLVTTNLFVRWYNNTPLFVGTLVLLALLVGLLIWLLLFLLRRKRKDEEQA